MVQVLQGVCQSWKSLGDQIQMIGNAWLPHAAGNLLAGMFGRVALVEIARNVFLMQVVLILNQELR
jgi:hypothetical protein